MTRPVAQMRAAASHESASWTIVDRRDNRPVTIVSFFSRESAQDQIEEWRERHARGGRPDVSLDRLDNMEPKLVSEAIPWGARHPCELTEGCRLPRGHRGDRCNTFDSDGHP